MLDSLVHAIVGHVVDGRLGPQHQVVAHVLLDEAVAVMAADHPPIPCAPGPWPNLKSALPSGCPCGKNTPNWGPSGTPSSVHSIRPSTSIPTTTCDIARPCAQRWRKTPLWRSSPAVGT